MTSDQVAALTTAQLSKLGRRRLALHHHGALAGLNSDHVKALTTDEVSALTTAQVAAITSDQLDGLTTAGVVALTTAQVAALKSDQVVSLNTDQLRAIKPVTSEVALDGRPARPRHRSGQCPDFEPAAVAHQRPDLVADQCAASQRPVHRQPERADDRPAQQVHDGPGPRP